MKRKSFNVKTKRWIAFFLTLLMLSGSVVNLGVHVFAADASSTIVEINGAGVRKAYAEGRVLSVDQVLADLPSFAGETEEETEALNQALADALREQLSEQDGSWLEVVESRSLEGSENIRILVAVRLALLDEEAEDAQPEVVGVEVYTINTGSSEESIEIRLVGEETQETSKETFALESKEVEAEKKPEKPVKPAEKPAGGSSSSSEPAVPGESSSEPAVPGESSSEPAVPGESSSEPAVPGESSSEPEVPSESSSEPTAPEESSSEPTSPEESSSEPTAPEETAGEPSTDEGSNDGAPDETVGGSGSDDSGEDAGEPASDEGVLVASIDGRIVLAALAENEVDLLNNGEDDDDNSEPDSSEPEDEDESDDSSSSEPADEDEDDNDNDDSSSSEPADEDESSSSEPVDGEKKEESSSSELVVPDEEKKETTVTASAEKVESKDLGSTDKVKLSVAPFTFMKVGFSLKTIDPAEGYLLINVVDQKGAAVSGAQVQVDYEFDGVKDNTAFSYTATGSSEVLTTDVNGQISFPISSLRVEFTDGFWNHHDLTIKTKNYSGTFTIKQISAPTDYTLVEGNAAVLYKESGSMSLSEYSSAEGVKVTEGNKPVVTITNQYVDPATSGKLVITKVDGEGKPISGVEFTVKFEVQGVRFDKKDRNVEVTKVLAPTDENGKTVFDYSGDIEVTRKGETKTIRGLDYEIQDIKVRETGGLDEYESAGKDETLIEYKTKAKNSDKLEVDTNDGKPTVNTQYVIDYTKGSSSAPTLKVQNLKATNRFSLRALAVGQSGLEFTYDIKVDGIPYNGTLVAKDGSTATVTNGSVTIPQDDNNGNKTYTITGIGVGQDVTIRETGKAGCKLIRVLHDSTLLDVGDVSFTSQKGDNGTFIFVNAKTGEGGASGAQLELTKKATRNGTDGDSFIYDMELTVAGKGKVTEMETPVNVIFVIDRSSSMRYSVNGDNTNAGDNSRWNITRRSINTMAKNLIESNSQSQVAAVYFQGNTGGILSSWTSNVGNAWITMDNPPTNQGTYAVKGFEQALYQLDTLKAGGNNNPTYVVFMTDGDESSSSGPANAIAKAKEINAKYPDVQIHTIGISSDPGTAVLNPQGENRYQDSYTRATRETDISDTFTGILNMIFENYEKPVVIDELSNHVELVPGSFKTWVNDSEAEKDHVSFDKNTFTWTINAQDGNDAILDGMENVHKLTYQVKVTENSTTYPDFSDPETGTHADDYGWYSNGIAELRCRGVYTESFPKPVVQTQQVINNQDIDILKIDGKTNMPLSGAGFVIKLHDEVVATLPVTGADGKVNLDLAQVLASQFGDNPQKNDQLTFGIYEINSPVDYTAIDGEIANFTVEYTGKFFHIAKRGDGDAFSVTDPNVSSYDQATGTLTVKNELGSKGVPTTVTKNFKTGEEQYLNTGKYVVEIKQGDTLIESITLGDNGNYTVSLEGDNALTLDPDKVYTVSEKIAEGANYSQDGNISITVSYDGSAAETTENTFEISSDKFTSVTGISISLTNKVNRGSVEFIKYGPDGETKLNGATFGIYSDANCTAKIAEATSGSDGKVSFENLPVGTYYVKEIKAPEHYQLSDKVYTAVVTTGDPVGLSETAVNQYADDGAITVVKKLADGTSLSFAQDETFSFTATKGDVTHTGTATFTNENDLKNGVTVVWDTEDHTLSGLEYGDWVITETSSGDLFELKGVAGDGDNISVANKVATVKLDLKDQNATVTFTNRAKQGAGSISLSKAIAVENPTYTGTFPVNVYTLNSSGTMELVPGALKYLAADGTAQSISGLDLDRTYYVKEGAVAGYTLVGMTVGGQTVTPVVRDDGSYYPVTLTGTAAVQVVVTNTATQYKDVNISVTKVLEHDFLLEEEQSFTFTLTGPDYNESVDVKVTKDQDGKVTAETITFPAPTNGWVAGEYTLSEKEDDQYTLTGITSNVEKLTVEDDKAFTLTDAMFAGDILFTATNDVVHATISDVTLEKVIFEGDWFINGDREFKYTLHTPDGKEIGITATTINSDIAERLKDAYGDAMKLPVGEYTLTEEDDTQFDAMSMAVTVNGGDEVVSESANSITFNVTKDTTKIELVSTNTVKTGAVAVKVTKTIPAANVGTEEQRTFQFTLAGPDKFSISGKAVVENGETSAQVVWENLPANLPYGNYTITEGTNDKFSLETVTAGGMGANVVNKAVTFTVNGNGEATATFHNVPKESGKLTIEKYLATGSKAVAGDSFTFNVYEKGNETQAIKTATITVENTIANNSGAETKVGSATVEGLIPGHEYVVQEVVPVGYAQDSIGVVTGSNVSETAEFIWEMDGTITVKAVNSNTKGNGIGSLTKVFETNGLEAEEVTFELHNAQTDALVATGTIAKKDFTGELNKSSSKVNWSVDVSNLPVGSYYVVENLAGDSNYEFKSAKVGSAVVETNRAEFTVTGVSNAVALTFTNEPGSNSGNTSSLTKVLANGWDLNSDDTFTITLTSSDGTEIIRTVTAAALAADADHSIELEGLTLKNGVYTVTESQSNDYVLDNITVGDDETNTFTIANNGVSILVTNKAGEIPADAFALKVSKKVDSVNAPNRDFTFTLTGPGISAEGMKLELKDATVGGVSGEFTGFPEGFQWQYGEYTITESEHTYYDFTSASAATGTQDAEARSFTFVLNSELAAKKELTVTFVNNQKTAEDGAVVLRKEMAEGEDPINANDSFTFKVAESLASIESGTEVTTVVGGNAVAIDGLKLGGTYYIKEANPGANYDFVGFTGLTETSVAGVYSFTVPATATEEAPYEIIAVNEIAKVSPAVSLVKNITSGSWLVGGEGKTFNYNLSTPDGKDIGVTATVNKDGSTSNIVDQLKDAYGDAMNLPVGEYTLTEEDDEQFDAVSMQATVGTVVTNNTENAKGSVTFNVTKDTTKIDLVSTNTVKTGAVAVNVTKTIPVANVGTEEQRTFQFTLAGPDKFSISGKAVVENGETSAQVVWENLPENLPYGNYTITESSNEKFSLDNVSATGADVENEVVYFTVADNDTVTATFHNVPNASGTLTIEKYLAAGSKAVAGDSFTFNVYEKGNETQAIKTAEIKAANDISGASGAETKVGSATIDGLIPGHEYVVKEAVPAGYALDSIGVVIGSEVSATAEFAWQVDGTVTVKAVNSNTKGNGIGSLTKVFETNGLEAEEVTFELHNAQTDALVATGAIAKDDFSEGLEKSSSKVNWSVDVSNLPVGSYYVVENLAGDSNYEFKSAKVGSAVVETNRAEFTVTGISEAVNLTFINQPKQNTGVNNVTVSKVLDNGIELAKTSGDSFQIVISDANGSKMFEKSVTAQDLAAADGNTQTWDPISLPNGVYTVEEIISGTNFVKVNDTSTETFTIASGSVEAKVVVHNKVKEVEQGNFTLEVSKKVDSVNAPNRDFAFVLTGPGISAEGIELNLKDAIVDGVSSSFILPDTFKWQYGTYTITEAGHTYYDFASASAKVGTENKAERSFSFTLNEDLAKEGQLTVTFVNNQKTVVDGAVTLLKTLQSGAEPYSTNDTFTFRVAESAENIDVGAVVTAKVDGQAVSIPGLKLGGTYYIKEMNPGADYRFVSFAGEEMEDLGGGVYKFTVSSDVSLENIFAITATNHKVPRVIDLPIYKYSSNGDSLADAGFTLYEYTTDNRGNPVAGAVIRSEQTTDAYGRLTITGLGEGRYVLKETKVPARHYTPNYLIAFEVKESNGSLIIEMINSNSSFAFEDGVLNIRNQRRSGGGGGGGGDDDDDDYTTITDSDVPLGEITIEDPQIPLAGLPDAGGFPVESFAVVGAGMMLAGWLLGRKKDEDEENK